MPEIDEHTGRSAREHGDRRDIQHWMVHLLARYSAAYASNQYRSLQQFLQMARGRR